MRKSQIKIYYHVLNLSLCSISIASMCFCIKFYKNVLNSLFKLETALNILKKLRCPIYMFILVKFNCFINSFTLSGEKNGLLFALFYVHCTTDKLCPIRNNSISKLQWTQMNKWIYLFETYRSWDCCLLKMKHVLCLKKKNHSKSPCKTNVNKFEHMYTGLIVNTSDLN